MPRRLLRDGRIIVDDWSYAAEVDGNPAGAVILSVAEWQSERE